jgi:Holliday junction resolvase RusA-like endonuclease
MDTRLMITVYGRPAPQGSKRHVGNGVMVESSKNVKPWRQAVTWAAMEQANGVKVTGPVKLKIVFTMAKPKKPKYAWPATAPDLSKLLRATEDALTDAGVWEDDARVVSSEISKVYPGGLGSLTVPGALISIQPMKGAA